MNTKEAVAKRILELCQERNMAVNALAMISGVSPSTIYSMLNEKNEYQSLWVKLTGEKLLFLRHIENKVSWSFASLTAPC